MVYFLNATDKSILANRFAVVLIKGGLVWFL